MALVVKKKQIKFGRKVCVSSTGYSLLDRGSTGQASESELYCLSDVAEDKTKASVCWIPPPSDSLKINCDGAFFAESKSGGWGFVIRDNEGAVRGSGAGFISHAASAAQVEAQACAEALQAAACWGMGRLIVESDARNVINALSGTTLDLTPEGVIYRDIRVFSRLNFLSVDFGFCPRSCNKLAHHELAALGARRRGVQSLWLESLPDFPNVPVASVLSEPII